MTETGERCEKTDLPVVGCAHCRKTPSGSTFPARFPDSCASCGSAIEVGHFIRETPTGRYEHGWH